MAGILIYSEKSGLALELFTAAKQINNGPIHAIVINDASQAEELSTKGLDVYTINNQEISNADTAIVASALVQVASQKELDTVLLSSDRRGKELAGRVAEAMNAGCLTDVKGMANESGQMEFIRNALGGATVAAQTIRTSPRVIAFSPRAFAPESGSGAGIMQSVDVTVAAPTVKLLETRSKAGEAVDLQAAERLVIVGQGVENRDDLTMVEQIAKVLQAEIGCSKPVATDKKWYPEERIIGLSGKICKPDLAVILGVSGQVQFTVGIREAQLVVSINSDENAFMNKISDYVLIADLQEALPELAKTLV